MKRKDFLKGTGLAIVGLSLPKSKSLAGSAKPPQNFGDCVLIPTETAGPFPLDLTENTTFFRQDVRENQSGVPLNLKLKIIGVDNCEPMSNLRVNIWHCNKDGLYSGYSGNNNPGQQGLTYLRGYQFTDANGIVSFTTIFPGWYTGRICHIHFQVYVSSAYAAISQLSFDIAAKNALYQENLGIYTKGTDPMSFSGDNVFSDGHDYQLATLVKNTSTGGYDAYMEVTIRGSGTVGVGHIEKETAKVFELGQNFPNPYLENTTILFSLKQSAEVTLELWDLSGKKVATLLKENKTPGDYKVDINTKALGLSRTNYVFQLEAKTENGIFRLPKMMTASK